MFQSNGDTETYCLYVYARINGLIVKSDSNSQGGHLATNIMNLVAGMLDVLALVERELSIQALCLYLYELCVVYNNAGKIIGSSEESSKREMFAPLFISIHQSRIIRQIVYLHLLCLIQYCVERYL